MQGARKTANHTGDSSLLSNRQIDHYILELKWLYRSWIEMMRSEPARWRTDLVIFVERNATLYENLYHGLEALNCSFDNRRTKKQDMSMCTLIDCPAVKNIVFGEFEAELDHANDLYSYLLNDVDIFDATNDRLQPFYHQLSAKLKHYANIDSIMAAFDGYEYLKSAKFDLALKTDTDVFLTQAMRIQL